MQKGPIGRVYVIVVVDCLQLLHRLVVKIMKLTRAVHITQSGSDVNSRFAQSSPDKASCIIKAVESTEHATVLLLYFHLDDVGKLGRRDHLTKDLLLDPRFQRLAILNIIIWHFQHLDLTISLEFKLILTV